MMLRYGGLDGTTHVVESTENPKMIKCGVWALTNLCRGTPIPEQNFTKPATPILCQIIQTQSDP